MVGAKAHGMLAARWAEVDQLPTTTTQRSIISLLVTLTVLAAVMYLLRVYCRLKQGKFGIDDYLLGLALAFAAADMCASYMYFKYAFVGFPSDNIDRQNADIVPALYWSYFMQVLYNPILALVKSSVLVLLLRIGSHRASIKWTIYVLQFLNLSLMVAIFFTILLQRIPIRAYWDPSVETRFKINSEQFIIVSAAITIVGDILVLVIPIWLFVGLRMRLSMKLGLICIFLLSGLVTCIGILRLVIIHHSFSEPKYDYIRGWDTAWSQIESTLAIIAACIPPLRPLLTVLMPGLFPPAGSAQPGVDSEACFATATVGGTKMPGSGHRRAGVQQAGGGGDEDESFELKHMGRSRAGVRAQAPSASQEDMMAGPGASEAITRVDAAYDLEKMTTHEIHERQSSSTDCDGREGQVEQRQV